MSSAGPTAVGSSGGNGRVLENLYAPIADDLDRARKLFDDTLFCDFPYINELSTYVQGYRGKMLRPALLLLTGRAVGEVTQVHVSLAAVVELIHVATLLHDDVLDNADLRRRRPTVSALRGNEAAVLLGDYLVSQAYHLCSSAAGRHAACRIGATTTTVCEGELMQIHHRGNCGLTEAEYFEIIDRKTAALTAVCGELGARFAGGSDETVRAMAAFGRLVGVAFQIVDDVLDIAGTEAEMGKTLGRDLDLGKPTLPAIHCLRQGEPAVARRLASVLGNGSRAPAADVRDWLDQCGSLEYAMGRASEFLGQAVEHLEVLRPGVARDSLAGVAHFMVHRQR
ncbi:MAG: polyprenyl synthetase family protein [Phycisphaerae bacterium]|nr:polyprenyl synthetase family protein [Phycisphaerae bacterium]